MMPDFPQRGPTVFVLGGLDRAPQNGHQFCIYGYLELHDFYTPQALHRNLTKFFTALRSMLKNGGHGAPLRARRSSLKTANEKLRNVRLADLTPQSVEEWKNRYLASRSENPVQLNKAKHTLDSYIRASKAIKALP